MRGTYDIPVALGSKQEFSLKATTNIKIGHKRYCTWRMLLAAILAVVSLLVSLVCCDDHPIYTWITHDACNHRQYLLPYWRVQQFQRMIHHQWLAAFNRSVLIVVLHLNNITRKRYLTILVS